MWIPSSNRWSKMTQITATEVPPYCQDNEPGAGTRSWAACVWNGQAVLASWPEPTSLWMRAKCRSGTLALYLSPFYDCNLPTTCQCFVLHWHLTAAIYVSKHLFSISAWTSWKQRELHTPKLSFTLTPAPAPTLPVPCSGPPSIPGAQARTWGSVLPPTLACHIQSIANFFSSASKM